MNIWMRGVDTGIHNSNHNTLASISQGIHLIHLGDVACPFRTCDIGIDHHPVRKAVTVGNDKYPADRKP